MNQLEWNEDREPSRGATSAAHFYICRVHLLLER